MPPKRRRRFHGLYYHSSPPKVLPMNGNNSNQNGRKRRDVDDLSVKLSTIRIWMHEKDIGKLTRILWAGQGNRLCQQASTNGRVKRFLAAVPYVMNSIKDVHQAVVDNNLETLQAKLEPPVPPALVTSKDANGLNLIHKAAGLGHTMILEYLIGVWPEGAHETDITGKTPLHWAASAKNNMRCYTLLTQAGCDEEAADYKMKTPSYYRHKPNELERAFLVYVPEAPRVSPDVVTDWEALSDEGGDGSKKLEPLKKLPAATNGFHARSVNEDSIENTSEVDLNDGMSTNGDKEMPKDEEPVENGKESPPATPEKEPEEEEEAPKEADDEPTEETNGTANEENNTKALNDTTAEGESDADDEATEKAKAAVEYEELQNGNVDYEEDVTENPAEKVNESDLIEIEENKVDESGAKVQEAEVEGGEQDNADADQTESSEPETHENEEEQASENEEHKQDKTNEEDEKNEADDKAPDETEIADEKQESESENGTEDGTVDFEDEKEEIDTEKAEMNEKEDQDNENEDDETKKKPPEETSVDEENEEQKNKSEDLTEDKKEEINGNRSAEAKVNEVVQKIEDDNEKVNGKTEHVEKNHTKETSDTEEDEDENTTAPAEDINANAENDTEPPAAAPPDPGPAAAQTADKLDENHNEDKYEAASSSPTSSLAIEGFVEGVPEDNTVQSQSAAYVDEEARIQEIISSGDMEQLAQIVLNGDGNKLLNMQSAEPEIQAFLNNVPNYMGKIRRVHEAAREGSLLSLQEALDRRKFAIAKDETSPNGATPLHVAVLFGNSDIVRYLAARFPETTAITDNEGRTALHYAATIKDNGHFYNVLTQMGANAKASDKLGHTPEFYLNDEQSKDVLSYRQLLSNFGAEELEDELLSDQVPDDLHSSRRQLQDGDIERTLERCFSVIEESSKVLSGTTASAVAHRKPLSASTMQLSITSYLSRFLKRSVFEKIKRRQTRLDHNLFDVIWPAMRKTTRVRHLEEDINCGIVAPDFDVFVVFQEFLVPLIKDMHCMSVAAEFKPHPRIAYFPMENGERLNTAAFRFEDDSHLIQRCTVECSRNLEEFELPLNLTIGQIEQAERMIMSKIFTGEFAAAVGETDSGSYYTLTEVLEENSDTRDMLAKLGLMIPLLDTQDPVQAAESIAFNSSLWPYGRGVYLNSDNNLALWLNCQEHLRVISTTSPSDAMDMGAPYTRVGRAVSFLESQLHFKESYLLGYLQARPSYLGTGLKFATTIKVPNLMKEADNLRHLCSVRGLSLITNPLSRLTVRLVNMQSMGAVEYVLFQDYCTAITNILSLEKDMSLTNSKHIATMLVKIFRRQATNQSYEANPIFRTEQGKYLANNLADPLIKALTEIANKRPEDPVSFLTNFLQNYARKRDPKANATSSSKTSSTAVINSNSTQQSVPHKSNNGNSDEIDTDAISAADEEEDSSMAQLDDRDEHGQSMLHFASARSHRRGGLLRLIEESNVDVTYRDELYRTARDVSLQANHPGNAKDIDRYVLSLAVVGDVRPFDHLAIEGYDHIIDVTDDNGNGIIDICAERGYEGLADFLRNLRSLEELREELHQMIRDNNFDRIKEITAASNAKWLLKAKNYYGRTAVHIAVLKEYEDIVEHLVSISPEILKIGDNLERTPLHYAMGTNVIESLSRILIQRGAKRTVKDLKGRQPSYYFMNKADILRLQEEEEESR